MARPGQPGPRSVLRSALLLLLWARAARAARAPNPHVIGADLLTRTAESCDLKAAFRVLNSSSFTPTSLTRAGSSGETALQAALRLGCAQVLAAIMLHPGFDFSATVRRSNQRRDLMHYALHHADPEAIQDRRVQWCLIVMHGIRAGKFKSGKEKSAAEMASEFIFHVPQPGEWLPPVSLEDMGIQLPLRPPMPAEFMDEYGELGDLAVAVDSWEEIVYVPQVVELWYIMVSYVQSEAGSERRAALHHHIRSLGWSLFFARPSALSGYFRVIDTLATGPVELPEEQEDAGEVYPKMGIELAKIWNKTGDFVVESEAQLILGD